MLRQRPADRFCDETNAARLIAFSRLESSRMSAYSAFKHARLVAEHGSGLFQGRAAQHERAVAEGGNYSHVTSKVN